MIRYGNYWIYCAQLIRYMAPLYFPKLIQLNYELMLRIKWLQLMPNLMQILSIFLKLQAVKQSGPGFLAYPVDQKVVTAGSREKLRSSWTGVKSWMWLQLLLNTLRPALLNWSEQHSQSHTTALLNWSEQHSQSHTTALEMQDWKLTNHTAGLQERHQRWWIVVISSSLASMIYRLKA